MFAPVCRAACRYVSTCMPSCLQVCIYLYAELAAWSVSSTPALWRLARFPMASREYLHLEYLEYLEYLEVPGGTCTCKSLESGDLF